MLAFDAFLIFKKIVHSLRRSVFGKERAHFRNYSYRVDDLPKKLPKTIWLYWDKPLDTAPDFVRYAISTWITRNPGWTVNVLNEETLPLYVEVPNPTGQRKIQGRSDAIRLALLAKYGGVWVDATCACVIPLSDWLPPLMQSGFFAFPDNDLDISVHSWFLAASRDNYLMSKWSTLAQRYYAKHGKLGHYFWVMHLFDFIVRTDSRAAAIWNFTPKISSKGPSLLKRIISQAAYAEEIPETIDELAIPMLKISSSNKFDHREFLQPLQEGGNIPLRSLASIMAEKRHL